MVTASESLKSGYAELETLAPLGIVNVAVHAERDVSPPDSPSSIDSEACISRSAVTFVVNESAWKNKGPDLICNVRNLRSVCQVKSVFQDASGDEIMLYLLCRTSGPAMAGFYAATVGLKFRPGWLEWLEKNYYSNNSSMLQT